MEPALEKRVRVGKLELTAWDFGLDLVLAARRGGVKLGAEPKGRGAAMEPGSAVSRMGLEPTDAAEALEKTALLAVVKMVSPAKRTPAHSLCPLIRSVVSYQSPALPAPRCHLPRLEWLRLPRDSGRCASIWQKASFVAFQLPPCIQCRPVLLRQFILRKRKSKRSLRKKSRQI